jgi:hypothetical protein
MIQTQLQACEDGSSFCFFSTGAVDDGQAGSRNWVSQAIAGNHADSCSAGGWAEGRVNKKMLILMSPSFNFCLSCLPLVCSLL